MIFLFTIIFVGLSGIVAQVIVLRELMVNFYGNELTVGIILANWVVSEALGVFIIGRIADKVKGKLSLFIALNITFALILPAGIYFARIFKGIIGVPFIEAVSLPAIFVSSFIIVLPLAFLHGALFSCGCKAFFLRVQDQNSSIGRVYTLETIGTIIGGFVLAYILIPFLSSFQAVSIISFVNIILTVILLPGKRLKYFAVLIISLLFFLFFTPLTAYLQKDSIKKQWKGLEVLDYSNSNYANIVVTKKLGQYTFFYNGLPVITTPFPDKQFTVEFGNLPLLSHYAPARVLIAGAGIGGLITEVLKHPITRLDYVEIDPLIIKMLKKYPTFLSEAEFRDRRVSIINTDPRLFLEVNNGFYDVILLGLSNQSDLSSNRFFTKEFFALAKHRLNPDGLIALWMPGSLTYLSEELKDLNSCILNSLKRVYKYVRVIPGDYNIFIASDSYAVVEAGPSLVSERITNRGIPAGILIPEYLEYRLGKEQVDWFNQEMLTATRQLNQDLRPAAVFETLKITNKKFSPQISQLFSYFGYLNLRLVFLAICLVTAGLFFISRKRRSRKISVAYSIFTTGFFGMLANLLLIFAYQVYYGCLYQKISILTAIFMAGIAAGSILMTAGLSKIKNARLTLILLEALIMGFSLFLGFAFIVFNAVWGNLVPGFYILFFISGLLMGLEFPLAGKMYLGGEGNKIASVSGVLYASDLLGGWLAGIFAGVVFLPILGLFNTCLLIVMLKLSSLFLLGTPNKLIGGHPAL